VLCSLTLFISTGCGIGYLVKSAYSQVGLLNKRVPIDDALNDPKLGDEQKRKLLLARDARLFAESDLGLKHTKNYTSYVQLDGPYVTYVVSAAERYRLKQYLWFYPIVGSLPYKGYFDPKDAHEEAEEMKKKDLDVYVRGVSAYSTLGWFRDPILSSMLRYSDFDLVDTIIHETTHATIYISGEADFNERLAMFIGQKGAELFFKKRDGENSPAIAAMHNEQNDEKLFGEFMSAELKDLDKWYDERKGHPIPEEERQARFVLIQEHFRTVLRPRLSSNDSYKSFETAKLNNAQLLTYRLYYQDLNQFEIVFQKYGSDFKRMLEFCKSLQDVSDPVAALAKEAGQN
jgi:predicted aminopeptidase